MSDLLFKDIKFGKIDARHELQDFGDELYMTSFFFFYLYRINDFLDGKLYYICGRKGTGKTAFLQYLKCKKNEEPQNLIVFIRFKSEFDSTEKASLIQSSNKDDNTIENLPTDSNMSYVEAWCAYIVNCIVSEYTSGEYAVFKDDRNFNILQKLLKVLYADKRDRIVPTLKHGRALLSISSEKGFLAEIEGEIGFDERTHQVDFTRTAKKIISLFKSLQYDRTPVYIFFDELELSVVSKKEFNRDIKIVRDLILAVEKMNEISKERGFEIKIIASIRSDVVDNINAAGMEINKCIEDRGIKIDWYHQGGDYHDSPLLKLIENKIQASEQELGFEKTENVWEKYFPLKINDDIDIQKYILGLTWQRPRDIIRMMSLLQSYTGESLSVTKEAFDRIMRDYSSATWNEIAEELKLAFPGSRDLEAIKQFLTGIEVPFTFQYLQKLVNKKSEIYDYVSDFFKKNKLITFLEKMYAWGVIGNSGQRMAFTFMGDSTLDPTHDMIIHQPLRKFFNVRSRRK